MALKRSAKKAMRSSARKKAFNDRRRRALKESVKEVRALVAAGKRAEAAQKLSAAYQAIDKAAKRGVIKRNTAARKKSRLSAAIKKLSK